MVVFTSLNMEPRILSPPGSQSKGRVSIIQPRSSEHLLWTGDLVKWKKAGQWGPGAEGRDTNSKGAGEVLGEMGRSYIFLKRLTQLLQMFICLWLHWVLLLCVGFLWLWLVGAALYLWYTGFSFQWLLWLWSTGSRAGGLQELQLKGSRVQAQKLCMWPLGMWDLP